MNTSNDGKETYENLKPYIWNKKPEFSYNYCINYHYFT